MKKKRWKKWKKTRWKKSYF